ncbi:MAG TPA: gephyrin-like molybdotransferase Glp [Hyphomicrobiales bacterium]|nr:gephyrin-like molybdotransferase Glp [Hyphomicrobiales bacterium]
MLSVTEALERVLAGAEPLITETVPLASAHERVLAADLPARLSQPPFPSSAMDGYAVRRADVETLPAKLTIIGESAAGRPFPGKTGEGETVRIFTGAAVPDGADYIVIQENVMAENGVATIRERNAESCIRDAGVDFKQGQVLLRGEHRLNARDLLLAAQMNYAELTVYRQPHAAILASGDELLPPGSELAAGQIISSIPAGLGAMLDKAGARVTQLGIARDTMDSLLERVEASRGADLLITIGGASVGDHDLVHPALEKSGFTMNFHKIAMRPGKPLMLGARGDQRVLGLPGNPISAMICTTIFVLPLIAALSGNRGFSQNEELVPLAAPIPENGSRTHYMRAFTRTEGGQRKVETLPSQDSSLTATLARADCLIIRQPHAPAASTGEIVRIHPITF